MLEKVINQESFKYFEKNYIPIFLYQQKKRVGGVDVFDILNNKKVSNPKFIIKDSTKTCRFCGKTTPQVSFKKKAHTFPEFLGNKLFVSKDNECDDCNELFSKYEVDLSRYIYPFLVTNVIKGKNGVKEYKSNDKSSTVIQKGDIYELKETMGSAKITKDDDNNQFTYEFDIQPYTPMNIYKILVKMAIGILPESEIDKFGIMRNYIIDKKLIGSEKCLRSFFPGFNRFELYVFGYKKNVDDASIPSYQFGIMNGNIMLQVPLYSDIDIIQNNGKSIIFEMVSAPTPFDFNPLGDKQCLFIDLSDNKLRTGEKQHMTMKYDKIEEASPPYDRIIE